MVELTVTTHCPECNSIVMTLGSIISPGYDPRLGLFECDHCGHTFFKIRTVRQKHQEDQLLLGVHKP